VLYFPNLSDQNNYACHLYQLDITGWAKNGGHFVIARIFKTVNQNCMISVKQQSVKLASFICDHCQKSYVRISWLF